MLFEGGGFSLSAARSASSPPSAGLFLPATPAPKNKSHSISRAPRPPRNPSLLRDECPGTSVTLWARDAAVAQRFCSTTPSAKPRSVTVGRCIFIVTLVGDEKNSIVVTFKQ